MGHLGYLAEAEVNKEPRASVGNHVFGSFGHDFKCSDGERVMIVGVSPNQWKAILRVTETQPQVAELEASLNLDFSNEGDRFRAREKLKELFDPWFGQRDSHAVHQALDQASVCWGPYQTIQQLVQTDSDCSVDNPLFEKVEQPGIGEYLMPSSPLNFEGLENVPVTPAPVLGQHTDEILGDTLGLSGGEIGKLHDSGVVAGPST
jgi:2-methylfumaryl-CoA isomerase